MIAEALKTIRKTPSDKFNKGCAAMFVNLGNGWGFKFYENKDVRDETHRKQKRAARYGLAPQVGRKATFKFSGMENYGYLTEVVRVCKDTYAEKVGINPNNIWYTKGTARKLAKIESQEVEERPEYLELIEKLDEKGFDTGDMHWGNVGYTDDGRMVAIDFDCA